MAKVALDLRHTEETPHVRGFEEEVSRAAAIQRALESLTTELDQIKVYLRDEANNQRQPGESSVHFAGIGDDVVRVTRAEAFRDLPEKNRPVLVGAIGEHATSALFDEHITTRLKPKADTAELMQALLDAGHDPRRWFTVSASLRPVPNFTLAATGLVGQIRPDQEERLWNVVDQVRHKDKVYVNPRLKGVK